MKILSHRGFWKNSDEKNKFSSFERTIKNGFGTETDLRDYNGEIVISHDIANNNVLNLDHIFSLFSDLELTLALNIKSDGLQKILKMRQGLEKFANLKLQQKLWASKLAGPLYRS